VVTGTHKHGLWLK
jgi:hypothetical protein